MAKEVFQLEVQVNSTPALTGINQVDAGLKKLQTSAAGIGKTNALSGLTSQTGALSTAMKGLGSVVAGLALGKLATDAIQIIASMQNLETVLVTVAGGATQAADAMKLIKDVASVTPFSVTQLGESFIKLKAAGIEPTVAQMKLFSDVASVTTDKVGALQSITDLYARTTAGGLGLEELNRLADRGIPVFDILSKRIGVNRLGLSELGKSAEGAQLILRNLEAGLSTAFSGASAKSLTTLSGQFELLKKNLADLAVGAGDAGARSALVDLTKALNDLVVTLKPLAASLGGELGTAIKGIGKALDGLSASIKFVKDNLVLITVAVGFVAAAFFLPEIAAAAASLALFGRGLILVFQNWRTLTAGLSVGRAVWVTITEVIENLGAILSRSGGKAIFDWFDRMGAAIAAATPKWLQWAAAILGVGYAIEKSGIGQTAQTNPTLPPTGAGAGRGNAQLEDYNNKTSKDRQIAQDLMTGRAATLLGILSSLKQESFLVGKTRQETEQITKEYELQASIKQKLLSADPTLSASELEKRSALKPEEKQAIANEIAIKYGRILENNFKIFYANNQAEISLIGKSSNEIEKQNKLREIQLQLGISDVQWAKEKLNYEEEITLAQKARSTESLNKNLEGIKKETEYLKLGNDERERRLALDQAATDAGYKNAEELAKANKSQYDAISRAISARQQTQVNVNADKEIENLKEQVTYESILNDKVRDRAKSENDLYKAIDPDGRGKKITEQQKDSIKSLLDQIENAKMLQEANKKVEEGFANLGSAVSSWALGTEGAINKVRLALVQLALTSIFKNQIAAGGATGNFISGILGGLSGRASGGPVSANTPYIVGEKRPEIFVPQTNGYIVPSTAMLNTRTGATSVTLAPNLIIHGSVTGQTELENMFDQFAVAMAAETQQFVIDQRGQNGILAR